MAVSDTLIGTFFDGRYQVVRKLGAGGMANVYLAEDQELGRGYGLVDAIPWPQPIPVAARSLVTRRYRLDDPECVGKVATQAVV